MTTRSARVLARARSTPRSAGHTGDRVLVALCALAGVIVALTLGDIVYQLISNAWPAISRFGLGFLGHTIWEPAFNQMGAAALIYGTAVSSVMALVLAGPLGIAIALYLAMMAPPRVRAVVGPVVEMLAAVPSIIYGFWGLIVLVPIVKSVEPGLNSALGFIPLFGAPQQSGISVFSAGLVLTWMILPIVAALSRDLFLTVPRELQDGAAALGATPWEVIRGVVLPSTVSGITAAMVLALGRALGEAIAVSLVIGDVTSIHASLFQPAATIAAHIAYQFIGASSALQIAALWYIGLVLLVIGLVTSLLARVIARRFDVQASYARAVAA